MKQFFEVFFGIVIIMIGVYVAAQGVLTNTQISSAREYHETCIERIENTGLSEDYIKDLVEYTNSHTDYQLKVEKIEGTDHSVSYHVSLTYPLKNVIYSIFNGGKKPQMATIDGFASIGRSAPSMEDSAEAAHGKALNTVILGTNVKGILYSDGYFIISGTGTSITEPKTALNSVKGKIQNVAFQANVKKVPAEYFSGTTHLTGISFGHIETIETNAFSYCPRLNSILLPKTVKDIQSEAFGNCATLQYVYVNNVQSAVTFAESSLQGCPLNPKTIFLINEEPTTVVNFAIIKQPDDLIVGPSIKTSTEVKVKGEGLKYQWQVTTDGGTTWKDSRIDGFNGPKIYCNNVPSSWNDGRMYRCVITNVDGDKLVSEPAHVIYQAD